MQGAPSRKFSFEFYPPKTDEGVTKLQGTVRQLAQLKRFSEACGAEIPRWIGKRMAAYGDDADSVREFAADIVTDMCRRLIAAGVAELHFYTLNLARPTQAVLSRLA